MKKIKQNRAASFAVVLAVYVLASAVGIAVYCALDLPWWLSLLIADAAATVFTFLFSIVFGNASVYDPYWSVQPPVILAAFAVGREMRPLGILLLAVSIPMADKRQSRKEGFADYRRETRMLLPIRKKFRTERVK